MISSSVISLCNLKDEWNYLKIRIFNHNSNFYERTNLQTQALRLPSKRDDLQLLQKLRLPATSLPDLCQGPYRRTQVIEHIWSVLKVPHLLRSINKVVGDLSGFFEKVVKELNNHTLDMKEHQQSKVKDQENLKKRIGEAKAKMMTVVERFFTDFEKEVSKSILCFNESMKENYSKVDEHVEQLKKEIEEKNVHLNGDKVLKTLIGFHAREEETKYTEQL